MRAILTYHSIDDSGSPISITEPSFRRHVEWLAAHGPRTVTVDELLSLPHDATAIAITFDDAFVSFAAIAWPILRDHGLTATLYVPTDHVGGTNAWGGRVDPRVPTLPICDWDTLGRLSIEGVMMGSHTRTHVDLTRVPDEQLRDELMQSAARIETMLEARAVGLAYPYGAHDPSTAGIAAATYGHACTTELRLLDAHADPHRLPRLDAYYLREAGMIEMWGTARWRLYLRARAGARRCRELLVPAGNR